MEKKSKGAPVAAPGIEADANINAKKIPTFGETVPATDIIIFSGPIIQVSDLFYSFIEKKKNENVLVVMTTHGGFAEDAYRMMRDLQRAYKKISVMVVGDCYSAGTIFCLGADEIIMGNHGELGPIDVQIQKEDDLMQMSGISYSEVIKYLSSTSMLIFTQQFDRLKMANRIPLSTRTASSIAEKITIGMLKPIFAQIEPIKLGEVVRAQNIGTGYSSRLMTKKYKPDEINSILANLATSYPAHNTIIDFEEAVKLRLHVIELAKQPYYDKFKKLEAEMRHPQQTPCIRNITDLPIA